MIALIIIPCLMAPYLSFSLAKNGEEIELEVNL